LYSSEGQRPKYIHVQEGENIQRLPLEKYSGVATSYSGVPKSVVVM
jgi:hypothetical protein